MINLNTASILLAKLFIENVRQLEKDSDGKIRADAGYKMALINDAYNVIKTNDFYEIRDTLLSYKGEKSSAYNISRFLKLSVRNERSEEELITLGRFYLHPILHETPKPAMIVMDYKTMEQKKLPTEKFYLEIVESFKVSDLLNYYYMKNQMDEMPGTSHTTQMKNLLTDYSLDMILYMIDASAMSIYDDENNKRSARTPAYLTDFIEESQELIDRRKNILIEGGLDKIVPRGLYEKAK